MSPKKIIIGAGAALLIVAGAFATWNNWLSPQDAEAALLKDYQALLKEVDSAKTKANLKSSCDNPQELASKMQDLANKLADLKDRKNNLLEGEFIPDLPPLPETESSDPDSDFLSDLPPLPELGRPGSEVPDLSDWGDGLPPLLPLPELGAPGSQVPELSDWDGGYGEPIPDLTPLPEGMPGSFMPDLDDYSWSDIPELPEIDLDSLFPQQPETDGDASPETTDAEASTDWVPPLPELPTDADFQETADKPTEKSDTIKKIEEIEAKIIQALNNLQSICEDKEPEIISDSCHEACQKYKQCASYGDDISAEDLQDAYDSCFEECQEWSKETVICINKKPIKVPNDCLNMTRCALPEYGGYIPN